MEAIELFGSGKCNLNCSYCYISKIPCMDSIQNKVIEYISNGSFIDFLGEKANDITSLSIWGGEPSLSLKAFSDNINKYFDRLPKLNKISFSTNFIELEPILYYINSIPKNKNLNLTIQISLDGPEEITDENRNKNTYNTVINNLDILSIKLNEINIGNNKLLIRNKSTLTRKNLRYFKDDISRVSLFFNFFDSLSKKYSLINTNKNVSYSFLTQVNLESGMKNYTQEDGILFSYLCKEVDRLINQDICNGIKRKVPFYLFQYEGAIRKMFDFSREIYNKHKMFTCSAGDSCFGLGLDGKFHICHRGFFFEDEEYLKTVKSSINCDDSYNKILNYANKFIGTNDDFPRISYVSGNYHNYSKFKINYGLAVIKELVEAGLINDIYKEYNMAYLLALFVNIGMSCPLDNIFDNGNIHLLSLGTYKFFGNGAFETILGRVCKSYRY